jgi:hypothetical protein
MLKLIEFIVLCCLGTHLKSPIIRNYCCEKDTSGAKFSSRPSFYTSGVTFRNTHGELGTVRRGIQPLLHHSQQWNYFREHLGCASPQD